jgi:hypothetical protein
MPRALSFLTTGTLEVYPESGNSANGEGVENPEWQHPPQVG